MHAHILVFDVGTSSLKAVVYGPDGSILCKQSRFYEFSSPCESWAEIDARIWWDTAVQVCSELRQEGVDLSLLKGIAVTGQMHSAVLLGEDDEPLGPSILWLDRRAAAETAQLMAMWKLPPYKLNSSYTAPKLRWLSKHRPEMVSLVRTMLWPKDYLRFKLTGCKVTDYTEGIGSALMDWDTRTWVPERIRACGMEVDVLPPIVEQTKTYPVLPEISRLLGLPSTCQVLVGSGDIAALLGGAPNRPGRLVYSLGSSSMYFTELLGEPMERNGLYSLDIGGYRLFGGVSSTTGSALNWAYEILWGGESSLPFKQMVGQVLDPSVRTEPLVFLPFLAGERSPFWSDEISGAFDGLGLHHTKVHLTRAVMEGVACSIRYILDLMEHSGVHVDELALAAGGAKTPGWPQLIAAVTDLPVVIYNAEETVATVLYAMMESVLCNGSFRDILASRFAVPAQVLATEQEILACRPLYRRYCNVLARKIGPSDLPACGKEDAQ